MSADNVLARRQQRVEALCAGAIRALVNHKTLHFRARHLHDGTHSLPIAAPHLYPAIERDAFDSFRGAADGLALRVLHSDATLHQSFSPAGATAALIFEILEQLRVESCVSDLWFGVKANLRARFERWSVDFVQSGLMESERGFWLYTLVQMCRSRLTGEPVVAETEDMIETTRGRLVSLIGGELGAIRQHRTNQTAYATYARKIAETIASQLDIESGETDSSSEMKAREALTAQSGFTLLFDFKNTGEHGTALAVNGKVAPSRVDQRAYQIFTQAYDQTIVASALARKDELKTLRAQLDQNVTQSGINFTRVAQALITLFALPAVDDWDAGKEEGAVDGARISQLICAPAERRLFRVPRVVRRACCQITVLIDCSGSMKQHNTRIATFADIFARAAERAEITVEILGFSTKSWNGGRAAKDWMRSGKSVNPGRLNERRHLIFKDAEAETSAQQQESPGANGNDLVT